MKIKILEFEIHGLGPFLEHYRLDFKGNDRVVILAGNKHGKTSLIDLIRWLLAGETATNEFQSINPAYILNRELIAKGARGYIQMMVDVEGKGTFVIRRECIGRGEFNGILKVFSIANKKPVEVPDSQVWLDSVFPAARIGFNLLTGEHIAQFVKGIDTQEVRTSLEKLLHTPELTEASQILHGLHHSLQERAAKNKTSQAAVSKAAETARKARTEVSKRTETIGALEVKIVEKRKEVKEREQRIGVLRSGLPDPSVVNGLNQEIGGLTNQLRSLEADTKRLVNDSWRVLLCQASHKVVKEELKNYTKAATSVHQHQHTEFFKDAVKKAVETGSCGVCNQSLKGDAKHRLQDLVRSMEAPKPTTHEGPIAETELRRMTDSAEDANVVEKLTNIQSQRQQFIEKLREKKQSLDSTTKGQDPQKAKEITSLERENERAEEELRRLISSQTTEQAHLKTAESDQKKAEARIQLAAGGNSDEPLGQLVERYAAVFGETTDAALPWYRKALQDRTQEFYDELCPPDQRATITLNEETCIPSIELPTGTVDLEREDKLSPGFRLRLGVALLLGLRQVAAEKPFLVLDAPFSELDDEGITALLRTLGKLESQVVIFTKNAFGSEDYEIVSEQLTPTVFEMDWRETPKAANTQGHTVIRPQQVEILAKEGA